MSRPYSSTGRPSTGSPPYLDPRYQYPETPTTASTSASDVQWAYGSNSRPYTGAGEDLYEEDESEDEDVFAYLPPTTAEQQAAQEHHQQPHIQPASAPLASVQPATYLNDRPALSSPTPVLRPSTPVHPSANRRPATASDSSVERSAPPESFRMRSLRERIPRQNKTPEVHVSLEDPEMQLGPKRSISSDHVMEQLPGPSALDDHKFAKHGDGATLSSLHFTASRRSDFSVEYEAQYEEEEDSPYPEVRASVSNIDDPEMPALTFRVWFIGMFLSMIAAGANTFFNFRYPAPTLVPLIMLLVSYPTGKFFAFILPIYDYQLPRWLGGGTFSFNPGPFNIKEHVLLYIMSNVATAPAYAMNVIVVAEHFYNIRLGIAWNLLLMFATQLTGFGIAGICRRYLVWPASMIWPQNLVVCTLLNTLHAEDDEPGRTGTTRFKFYLYVTIGTFVWQFLPGFLFTALSAFSWICWFRPRDVKINQLFGVYSGLGMGVLTFDWAQISYVGSPMMVPWWAEVHVMLGFLIFYWILTPILYYKNVWNFAYLPMSTSGPYDRFGKSYNVSRVIDMQTYTLNVTAYEEYSELYLPATYAVTYLLAFSVSTAVLVHTILYHGPTLLAGLKNLRVEDDDVHARLMRLYPEVPDWWYLVVLVTFFGVGMVAALVWPTGMPWWGMPFSLLLPVVYIVPIAYVYAMTGQPVNINLLSEIIPGSLIHGKPLPNMIFKSYAVQSLAEALTFVQDLKLGHYIKVAPRSTFIVQMVATFSSAVVQVGVKEWMFHNIKDMCTENQPQKISCPHYRVYFTASAVWGLIGPTRMFGKGATYNPQLYALLFGALIPIPFWFWQRKFPQSRFRYINIPVLLNGPMWIPPATGINYSSWFVVGFFFQYILRRRNFRWWSKFNYALSAALDSGTFLSLIILFFCVQFPLGDKGDIQWWGNTVHVNTADYLRQPLLTAPPEGFS
ncbi:Sexual differentiation process protein isp4 [Schizosaccharomyces pombe 972h-] [Rhizoctonia solani]|uniref:Sexual differentiation process protein isp4 [Schizosaccharomyces pombe 972h-] n=1 Tax=Rhizoctonia solani TaxID=456999 RepID=A0A0K6GBI6_9AGAM|nr:Sexual differentiation process protein isp4 [Schizosaccharomyces pombe 972h-] [Rhizoctonia solani]